MISTDLIAVITHNPKGEWGDVRPTIEEQGYYDWSRKSIGSPKIGEKVLIYISKGVFRIEYVMQIKDFNDEIITLDLILKIDESTAQQLSFDNLVQNGLKPNTVNYILNNNESLYKYVTDVLQGKFMSIKSKSPLNQILYGPPGTGKTYNTITKALAIIDGTVPSERKEAKAKFEEYRKSGQIEFITFHQSYGYEEFVEGIRAIPVGEEGNADGEEMIYAVKDGIFKRIAKKSMREYLFYVGQDIDGYKVMRISDESIFLKTQRTESIIPIPKVYLEEIFQLLDLGKLTIEDIKEKQASYKMSPTTEKYLINGYPGVYARIAELYLSKKLGISSTKKQNYILIIDEINRGNISKIFGELITLIEPSKRIGADEAIKLKLPYSNEEFGVPQNLYIIGTMNTADRSIALMDTALRRRFHFEEMMPDVEILSDKNIDGIDLKKVLTKINQRVEYLYDLDHTIGHAYFIDITTKEDLDDVMRNKIFPLLQEYFYDDWEKILMVLGDGFVDQREVKSNIFDDETNEYFEDKKFIYSIKESFDYTKLQS